MYYQLLPDEEILSKLSSNYCLKTVFSYVNYQLLLNLIKHNKHLQNKLGINSNNYKNEYNFQYIKRKITRIYSEERDVDGKDEVRREGYIVILSFCCSCCCFIYYIIYPILLVSLNLFDKNNLKENYDEKSLKIIKLLNILLFPYFLTLPIAFFFYIIFIFKNNENLIFKSIIVIIILMINCTYEGLIIYKLILSYKIKKKNIGITWFMVLDYIFLSFNFLYICSTIVIDIFFFIFCAVYRKVKKLTYKFILTSFKGVKINYFVLPDDFGTKTKLEKINCIVRGVKLFQFYNLKEEMDLIADINNFRIQNNLPKLSIITKKQIPQFIINPSINLILNTYNNVYKYHEYKYLFRYQIGEFERRLSHKDKVITDILLREKLNQILVVRQGDIQYIEINQSSGENEKDFIEPQNDKTELLLKYEYYNDEFPDKEFSEDTELTVV